MVILAEPQETMVETHQWHNQLMEETQEFKEIPAPAHIKLQEQLLDCKVQVLTMELLWLDQEQQLLVQQRPQPQLQALEVQDPQESLRLVSQELKQEQLMALTWHLLKDPHMEPMLLLKQVLPMEPMWPLLNKDPLMELVWPPPLNKGQQLMELTLLLKQVSPMELEVLTEQT